jgi:hypothetical protein
MKPLNKMVILENNFLVGDIETLISGININRMQ